MDQRHLALLETCKKQGIQSQTVLDAMSVVDRKYFVPDSMQAQAYENHPLPIGSEQTISQPFIVARMTEMLLQNCDRRQRVLEIGTGSGYQAAILAQIFDEVYSIERIESHYLQAEKTLATYQNIKVRYADGQLGWPEAAPFDGIIVTAAAETFPETLMQQCNTSGSMIIPIGKQHDYQQLCIARWQNGSIEREMCDGVRFVPLLNDKT